MSEEGSRVLVIDDSEIVAMLVQEELVAMGHDVRTALDGMSGLAVAAEWLPEVVVCDLKMPGLSGIEVVERLKLAAPLTPVLIFTDTSDLEWAVDAMQCGAWGYVVKGPSLESLNGEVLKALSHRRVMLRNHELELASQRHQQELEQLVEFKTREVARLEAARARAERLAAMGSFVAGIAHEVNNPLAVIKSNSAYLSAALPNLDEDAAEALAEIRSCTLRIQRIVEGLKRSSTDGVTREQCELAPTLDAVRLAFREQVPDEVTVQWQVDASVKTLAMPANDLVLVLSNLIINAAHAVAPRGPEGEISVRLWREQDWAKAEVRDNGTGMSPEIASRIFDTFFTTKPPGKGSGLGLSLARQVVENAGGTLIVQSAPGLGATFTLTVPAELGLVQPATMQARR